MTFVYPKNARLALCSENYTAQIHVSLSNLFGGDLTGQTVCLIPNAGEGKDRQEMVSQYLRQFADVAKFKVQVLDLLTQTKASVLSVMESADIVSFSGGMVSRLVRAIDKVGIRLELVELIKSGKPTIGFSSGSMVMSSSVYFATDYIGEPDLEIEGVEPLGVVGFEMYPHFENAMLASVKQLTKGIDEAYALGDNEALVVAGGKLYSIGKPVSLHLG